MVVAKNVATIPFFNETPSVIPGTMKHLRTSNPRCFNCVYNEWPNVTRAAHAHST